MNLRHLVKVISIVALVAGCQSTPTQEARTEQEVRTPRLTGQIQRSVPRRAAGQAVSVTQQDLWERVGASLSWHTINRAEVDQARERFLRQPAYLRTVAKRANYYLYHIVEEVQRRDMPMEVALLPLVESALNPFAYSPARAAGLWQIMPATGRHLGLQQDYWYDGRRDLLDSTDAALDYLASLHQEFDQDWLLALAAYNCGNGRVGRAIKANANRGLDTDYWSLSLPRETRRYVPKLLALAQIFADPDHYGVKIPAVANEPAFEVVATGGQLELQRVAMLAGIKLETLRALNPGQLRWATSPDAAEQILLPVGAGERFEQGVTQLDEEDRVKWQHYSIKRGDSLIRIAKTFQTDVALLQAVNGLSDSRIRAGDTLLIPRGNAWASSLALQENSATTQRGYKVRRGDSLYRIANQFDVSIGDIIAWNALEPGRHLQPGQKLTLFVQGG